MRSQNSFATVLLVCAALSASVFDSRSALAQRAPVIVVPGRAGIPVFMWGQDVSGSVIEGEFGLDRPGHMAVTIIPPFGPYYEGIPPNPPIDGYFPSTGTQPRFGRDEKVPPPHQAAPAPAPSFSRSWTSESPNLPATIPPDNPPPVIVAPQINEWPQQRPRPFPRGP
jgi:hypothetical protein